MRYSFHLTIASLFVAITLAFGLTLSAYNYSKTSEILRSDAERVFAQVAQELTRQFQGTYNNLEHLTEMIALTPVVTSENLTDRLRYLEMFRLALRNPKISAIQVGYDNGDYLLVRPCAGKDMQHHFQAPTQTSLMVDHIVNKQDHRQRQSIFFDANLQEISRTTPIPTTYDPRNRPWYSLALTSDRSVVTPPYLFYFTKKVGSTVSLQAPHSSSVVATDITLDQFSQTIVRHKFPPRTEVVLINHTGKAIAYSNPKQLIHYSAKGAATLATLTELKSGVLQHLANKKKIPDATSTFAYHKETWYANSRQLPLTANITPRLLIVTPEAELFQQAIAIRWRTALITAAILLLIIPIIWFMAQRIARPLKALAVEADKIHQFDFSSTIGNNSAIKEIYNLGQSMALMKSTISQFLALINSLAAEQNFTTLLDTVTRKTMKASQATGALTLIINASEDGLLPTTLHRDINPPDPYQIPEISLADQPLLQEIITTAKPRRLAINRQDHHGLTLALEAMECDHLTMEVIPLENRNQQVIGLLCLLFPDQQEPTSKNQLAFVQAISGFAAVSLESKHLLALQKDLLDSFIQLLASAIDAKSPYTGAHCQRVPVITKMLAEAACACDSGPFAKFSLSPEEWEELHIAAWLHDCGKITTPEFVVDKATKLETKYDRIHEIRMRFEVLKRDAEINYWQQLQAGGDQEALREKLHRQKRQLDNDFAFVAACNEGHEFMAEDKIKRLHTIAQYHWQRTLDDRLGVSWEERQRQENEPPQPLPAKERLLADKKSHLIPRGPEDHLPDPQRFPLPEPEYKYNLGELYNLQINRGTLNQEERYQINDHIVQTIIMLEKLPYPRHLRQVPTIAGGHHEKMDGSGYPCQLHQEELGLTARMMAIADIFEALTASDRPYKKAKKLTTALQIMQTMANQHHIDPALYNLFLEGGVYNKYAQEYLPPDQCDQVDIAKYRAKSC